MFIFYIVNKSCKNKTNTKIFVRANKIEFVANLLAKGTFWVNIFCNKFYKNTNLLKIIEKENSGQSLT